MQSSEHEENEGELEEETEEHDEEEPDESGDKRGRGGVTGRGVTLQMLLGEGILQPGEGAMTIDYLGQKFMGDLLSSGKIKSQETNQIFGSPSAWAIHCKKIVNPEKKSGCGWASVKYRGKKLDAYKTSWFKKKREDQNKENEGSDESDVEKVVPAKKAALPQRIIIKHTILGNRASNHDANTLVESTPFSALGKIQPFMVSMATNALLVMDFHSHLTTSEVVGYLGGHWDVNAHNLAITHTFPCRCRLGEKTLAAATESEIHAAMQKRHLTLVGWYHSHPSTAATPTIRDIDVQMEYQIKMKGNSDASYTPCVGVICSPYNKDSEPLESAVVSYWVMPPPESRPHEYGKPMAMVYSIIQDGYLSQDVLTELKLCAEFYKGEPDFIHFNETYRGNSTYMDKLKATLSSKFPRDQSDGKLWDYLQDIVSPPKEPKKILAVPSSTSPKKKEKEKSEIDTDRTEKQMETNKQDTKQLPGETEVTAVS